MYVTPTKALVHQLAKSPSLKNTNIIDQLNKSVQQGARSRKMPCPVCGQEVPERFLNIHLDKCLMSAEQPSPVFTKKTKKKRTASQAALNPFLLDSSQESVDVLDFLDTGESQGARSGSQGARSGSQGARRENQGARRESQGARRENQGARSGSQGNRRESQGASSGSQGARREQPRRKAVRKPLVEDHDTDEECDDELFESRDTPFDVDEEAAEREENPAKRVGAKDGDAGSKSSLMAALWGSGTEPESREGSLVLKDISLLTWETPVESKETPLESRESPVKSQQPWGRGEREKGWREEEDMFAPSGSEALEDDVETGSLEVGGDGGDTNEGEAEVIVVSSESEASQGMKESNNEKSKTKKRGPLNVSGDFEAKSQGSKRESSSSSRELPGARRESFGERESSGVRRESSMAMRESGTVNQESAGARRESGSKRFHKRLLATPRSGELPGRVETIGKAGQAEQKPKRTRERVGVTKVKSREKAGETVVTGRTDSQETARMTRRRGRKGADS